MLGGIRRVNYIVLLMNSQNKTETVIFKVYSYSANLTHVKSFYSLYNLHYSLYNLQSIVTKRY